MKTFITSLKKTVAALALMLATTASAWAQLNWSGTVNITSDQTISQSINLSEAVTVNISH